VRIGIHLPHIDRRTRKPLDAEMVAERAQWVEEAGFNGIWVGDHLPIAGVPERDHAEPFLALLVAAMATKTIEVGTCIYGIPLRNAADIAMHLYTFQGFAPGRLTFGVGTGSSPLEYELAGVDWADRYKLLHGHMAQIRGLFRGEMIDGLHDREFGGIDAVMVGEKTHEKGLAEIVGMPETLIGAWYSGKQIQRAATEYDGWIASAGPMALDGSFSWQGLRDSMKHFREMGGKRAIITSIPIDPGAPAETLHDDSYFHMLYNNPAEGTDRLKMLEDIGFDDILLSFGDSQHLQGKESSRQRMAYRDFTREDLDKVRALWPGELG
jgi:alkanesulfonate monooxygenase SsuD/methylene tetrahydromethanopterin reductase-like flavin-dependent oxidoreductase (luciferase family)